MPYTPQQGIEFWFEFDNAFLPSTAAPAIHRAYRDVGGIDGPLSAWEEARALNRYPADFVATMTVQPVRDALLLIADTQLAILERHSGGDPTWEQAAFEDFGQGVLFDARRPPRMKVHMMDTGGVTSPPVGYHRWHPFIRGAVAAGADAARWDGINRLVALAWSIQLELNPRQDDPANPPMNVARLTAQRNFWLAKPMDEIERAFDAMRPPPVP